MCQTCTEIENLKKSVSELQKEMAEVLRLFIELKNGPTRKTIYNVKEAAALLGKSAYTVSEWCRQGRLPASRSGKEGMYFITSDTITNFTRKQ